MISHFIEFYLLQEKQHDTHVFTKYAHITFRLQRNDDDFFTPLQIRICGGSCEHPQNQWKTKQPIIAQNNNMKYELQI
jgi:hypothetical protein